MSKSPVWALPHWFPQQRHGIAQIEPDCAPPPGRKKPEVQRGGELPKAPCVDHSAFALVRLSTYLIPSKDLKIHYKIEKLLLIYFRISFLQFLVHAKPLSTSRSWQRLWHLPETPFPTPHAFSGLCPTHSLGLAFHLMAPLLEHLFGALTTVVE